MFKIRLDGCIAIIIGVLLLNYSALALTEQRLCGMERDYWLYTPEIINPAQTYWLVVGVHGFRGNGKGAAKLADWAKRMKNVIVVGPTFPSEGPYYQTLGGNSDRQLIQLHKDLSKEFKLHEKMFIYGYSGGSQFAHRFALKYPDLVIGVSAHSGGTWESKPHSKAAEVIWTISCGIHDTHHSAGAPKTRIEYFRNFSRAMMDKSFTAKIFVTDKAHKRAPEVFEYTEECFRVATTGIFDYQRKKVEEMSVRERESFLRKSNRELRDVKFDDGEQEHSLKVNQDGWMVSSKGLRAMEETRKLNDRLTP